MKKYSIPERTQIVKLFYQNRESIISTQRAYRRHYQVRNAASDNAIRNNKLWGYLKDKVFANKPRTLQELKDNIRNEIMDLNRNPEIFRAVSGSVLERAIMCQNENGRHLKDVIFHK